MEADIASTPLDVIYRGHAAQNRHDLDAYVDCFASDFRCEMPVHPGREFIGRAQVYRNWSLIFEKVPDFRCELLGSIVEGDMAWAEWRWFGSRADGSPYDVRGVIIFQVQHGRISWARLFMEPVRLSRFGIDTYMQRRFQVSS